MGKRINFLLLTIHVYLFISLTHTCDFYCKRLNKFLFLFNLFTEYLSEMFYLYIYQDKIYSTTLCRSLNRILTISDPEVLKKKINSLVLHGSKPFSQSLQKSYFIVYRNEFKFTVSFIRKSI